jgi:hypothetical protein
VIAGRGEIEIQVVPRIGKSFWKGADSIARNFGVLVKLSKCRQLAVRRSCPNWVAADD